MPDKIALRTEKLGGVNTRIIQFAGTNPDMPTVFYHPGIFGSLESLTNIPRLALESGCSFLALNTIDQDPNGTYPPRNIDFDQCMKIIEEGMNKYITGSGVIPILNSWGSFPTTLALHRNRDIDVKALLTVGGTMNAHNELETGLAQYFKLGVLSQEVKEAFKRGETISNVPYPPPPHSDKEVSINLAFFRAHDGKIPDDCIISVKHQIICIRGKNDEHVTEEGTDSIAAIYKNSVDPDRRATNGGHWAKHEAEVAEAFGQIVTACKLGLAA